MAWTADGRWIPEEDSVAKNLTGLLATNGQYMQTARAGGQRLAAKRGLLNTSIAGGAAESAAIAAAAPIASQDAAQTAAKNMAVLEGGIQGDLQKQQNVLAKDLQREQLANNITLQGKEAEFQRQRDEFQFKGATEQQLREFDQRSAEQLRNIEAQTTQQREQLSSAERQAMMQVDTRVREAQVGANAQLSSQYLNAFSNLANNPDIPAATRNAYIAEFQRVMREGQAYIATVQGMKLNWTTATTPQPSPPGAQPTMTSPYGYNP